ncbi:probable serine/threonine-protein kinase yakA [Drosophila elegans]|uniref:probable serine/threonine-protein kinase yakA n=1 Tax=Drosophila elegans TaxID=30023 RepID=UPI0007E7968C|nr:probable serine/threonine-protein kinase yakA [Drosophila elegans]
MRGVLVLLLLVASSQVEAATHVNISIAQQPATNPADVKYLEGSAPAELRAGPQRSDGDQDQHFQRIQSSSQSQQQQQQQMVQTQQQQQQPQQLSPRQGLGLQPPTHTVQGQPSMSKIGRVPRRRNQSRRPSIHQQPPVNHSGQFRQRNQQLRQNQEFERYIQSYHSHGPTVETVYESSNPTPQRYTQTSAGVTSSMDDAAPQKLVTIGGGHRSQQLRMFERQVAAPVASQGQSANVEVAPADSKPIYEPAQQGPIQTPSVTASSSSSTGGASVSSSSSSATSASSAPAPAAPSSDSSSGYDSSSGFNPATSYNRPSYDPSGFNYEDAPEVDYQDQYPPELVDDGQGYEDYGGGSGYLPPAPPSRGYSPPQRPLVTKTIQIVQPALKAKKYEVRHPAIQKEFYDIEERVVIKPAGTLVVELEHPVAKIPKGETLLPLGHPHPAVASAYSNGNNGQTYGNNGEYRPSYEPASAVKDQQTTTIGSSVTTMPSYNQAPKDDYVESRLHQQQQQPLGDVTDGQQKNSPPSFVTGVDAQGNAIKINSKHLSPNMVQRAEQPEQPDYPRSGGQRVVYQQRTNYNRQPYSQEDDDYFAGEYLPNVNAGKVENKPARLELAEVGDREEAEERPTQIIKHEHKIHLPPSQHNIYLGSSRTQVPLKERRIQEVPAQVSEIKPYLKNHMGPTVVYAKSQPPRSYYNKPSRQRVAEELDYSAPYSQMRFSPDGSSSRLRQSSQMGYKSERLMEAPPKNQEKEELKKEQNTHIQIQIANDQVASTITPDCDRATQQKSQRLVEAPVNSEVSATQATPSTQAKSQPDVDVSQNGAAGHLKPNERVIAATAAPTDASATSETFHKRRIVINHPFQTVREVVEHEPFTNYHQIQVNEPAPPSHYHQAYYQPAAPQTHGSLVHFQTSSTHGNLFTPYG